MTWRINTAAFATNFWSLAMTLKSLAIWLCLPALAVAAEEKGDKAVHLKPGDKAPAFQAKTDEGKTWKSADHVGKKILVVYFYPADFTGEKAAARRRPAVTATR